MTASAASARTSPLDVPSPAELVRRAESMIPTLRSRAAAGEAARHIPNETIQDFQDAGFFEILKPAAYGGYEYEPQVMLEVCRTIARGCAPSAWVTALLIIHNWEIGLCDPQLAEDMWGANRSTLISSSYAPFGTATQVEGGFRVSGRWPWSSGSDHCQWVVLGVFFPEPNNPALPIPIRQRAFYIPRSDYDIDQTSWHMTGMQATGSKDIVVKDVFVPNHRAHDLTESFFDHNAGADAFPGKTFKYSFGQVFAGTLATVLIGAAEGAMDVYLNANRGKRTPQGTLASESPYLRLRAAEAWAMINAARALQDKDFAEAKSFIDRGEAVPREKRVMYKWNAAYASRLVTDAVDVLMKSSGGGAYAQSHPLQRFFHDIKTGSNHAFIHYENHANHGGNFLFTGFVGDFLV